MSANKKLVHKHQSTWRYYGHQLVQSTVLKGWLSTVLDITVKGQDNLIGLTDIGSFIIIANHQSHFDAPLIIGSMPTKLSAKIAVGAASDYFFKSYLQSKPTRVLVNTYPIDRNNDKTHHGLSDELVKAGVPILVFPEGTRSRTGKLGQFHTGLARIAMQNQVPILPVALTGCYQAWPAGKKLWCSGRPGVTVEFLPLIFSQKDETVEQLTDRTRQAIISACD